MDFNFFSDHALWIICFIGFAFLMPTVVGRTNNDDDDGTEKVEEQARQLTEDEEQHLYDDHH